MWKVQGRTPEVRAGPEGLEPHAGWRVPAGILTKNGFKT